MAELVAVGGAELVDAVDFHFLFIVFMLRKNKSCTSVSLMYRTRYISLGLVDVTVTLVAAVDPRGLSIPRGLP